MNIFSLFRVYKNFQKRKIKNKFFCLILISVKKIRKTILKRFYALIYTIYV